MASLINYGERYRSGERISSAFVEATVNAVVSKRFAKKQQMQWSRCGAHLLLQARTKTLDGTLRSTFERWYPGLANDNDQRLILAQTAGPTPHFLMLSCLVSFDRDHCLVKAMAAKSTCVQASFRRPRTTFPTVRPVVRFHLEQLKWADGVAGRPAPGVGSR